MDAQPSTITMSESEYYEQRAKIAKLEYENNELAGQLALANHDLARARAEIDEHNRLYEHDRSRDWAVELVDGYPAADQAARVASADVGKAEASTPRGASGDDEPSPGRTRSEPSPAELAHLDQFADDNQISERFADLADDVGVGVASGEPRSPAGAPARASTPPTVAGGANSNSNAGVSTSTHAERVRLDVAFAEKDEAKAAGAAWDPDAKTWYAPIGADLGVLAPWLPEARIYLTTAYAEKDVVKALGARWDATRKAWFITPKMDKAPFNHWLPRAA